MIEDTLEIPIPSMSGVRRVEFDVFGLTDAIILDLCATAWGGLHFSLLTADNKLAVKAEMLGYDVLNFRHLQP